MNDYLYKYSIGFCEYTDKNCDLAYSSKVVALNPQNARSYEDRAYWQEQLGKLEEAVTDLTKAIELDPNNGKLFNKRALVFKKSENNQRAIDDFKKAIELNPQDSLNYSVLADIIIDVNKEGQEANFLAALKILDAGVEANSNNRNVYLNRASFYRGIQYYRYVNGKVEYDRTAWKENSQFEMPLQQMRQRLGRSV